eukprot:5466096-Pleurochrysis_carterae.AAC.2
MNKVACDAFRHTWGQEVPIPALPPHGALVLRFSSFPFVCRRVVLSGVLARLGGGHVGGAGQGAALRSAAGRRRAQRALGADRHARHRRARDGHQREVHPDRGRDALHDAAGQAAHRRRLDRQAQPLGPRELHLLRQAVRDNLCDGACSV